MSDVKEFMFTVYSTKLLPSEVRTTFKLPKYPFKNGVGNPIPEETKDLFEKLGIVHYRDELTPFAVMCVPDGMDTEGFPAYRTSGILKYHGMVISRWLPAHDPTKYRKIVTKNGDDAAWMVWNQQVIVLSMDEGEVQLG
jgi:hypothetical protein